MTNMTISTSISQKFSPLTSNIPSLPVCGVYRTAHTVCQGLLLLGVFYSESSTTFVLASQIIMGYVRIRLKSSLMKVLVDMEISPNIMIPPSLICYRTFWDMIIYSDIRHWSDISLNRDLVTELDLFTVFDVITLFREVSIGHLQRVLLADRGHLLLRTPGPVPFGTCICSYRFFLLLFITTKRRLY